MADVTLAEANGNVWLVGGDAFIDQLLANTLAAETTIEIIQCADLAEVMALWEQNGGDPSFGAAPWAIHPGIVGRIRNQLGPQSIAFTPWSVLLDATADAAIAGAAEWLHRNPAARLTLRQFAHPDAPAGAADLQRLRDQLVTAALQRAGVPPDRIDHGTIAADTPGDTDRLALVTGDASTIASA